MATKSSNDPLKDENSTRRDLNPRRQCSNCGKAGLRYENKSGLCSDCHLSQPGILKAIGSADLDTVVRLVVTAVVDYHGEFRAPTILGVDRRSIYVVLGGGSIVGEVIAPVVDLDIDRLDPYIARLMMRRYRDLEPLDPGWSAVVEPWRHAMRAEIEREGTTDRRRRVVAADERADVTCFVPPITASFDHSVVPNAYGRYAPGSPRRDVPMRIAVALWALGFGAVRICRIATDVGVKASPSALGRVLKQGRRDFHGAEAVDSRDLTAELSTRPSTRSRRG